MYSRLKESDALLHDNAFVLPLHVSDSRRVLIVNGGTSGPSGRGVALASLAGALAGAGDEEDEPDEDRIDGATILRYALNPGRELGLAYGTGIDPTMSRERIFVTSLARSSVVRTGSRPTATSGTPSESVSP